MHAKASTNARRTDLQTPVRNRYFYGKLMDVYHFELETNYLNAKRWLLNRLVFGAGVVCGLDVQWAREPGQIVVTPGVAIDRWGREIVVPEETAPLDVPTNLGRKPAEGASGTAEREDEYVHLVLCYHECLSDPAPVLSGECGTQEPCAASAIRERYKLGFCPGCAPPFTPECRSESVLGRTPMDYPELVRLVCKLGCPPPPKNPCIPLANIRVSLEEKDHRCVPEDIHIETRPIVFTNLVLFDLLFSKLERDANGLG